MSERNIVLFHYPFSPWGRKVRTYLGLRNIPYQENYVPLTMPRPVLEDLNINYRLIPLMAVDRDVYCDTSLIFQALDDLFPASEEHPALSAKQSAKDAASKGTFGAMEKLLENYTSEMFKPAGAAIPPELYEGIPGFAEDRLKLWGRSWEADEQKKLIPGARALLVQYWKFLESLLADGRTWISGGDRPMLVDIHAAFLYAWLDEIDILPKDIFNKGNYPKASAYIAKYCEAYEEAIAKDNIKRIGDPETVQAIEDAKLSSSLGMGVDSNDPQQYTSGAEVAVWPEGTTKECKDVGQLVCLNAQEVAISKKTKNGVEIRVHYPRWHVNIEAAGVTNGGIADHGGDEGLGAEHYEERH